MSPMCPISVSGLPGTAGSIKTQVQRLHLRFCGLSGISGNLPEPRSGACYGRCAVVVIGRVVSLGVRGRRAAWELADSARARPAACVKPGRFRGVGAGNSAVVVDLPRCGPMLIRRVPNLVPILGVTGSAHCAVGPLEGPRDHRLGPPTRRAAPTGRPTRDHRRRPELARGECGRATATEPSRVAGHPRHAVALAPPPHRRTLDSTTATAGPAIDLSEASPTHAAPRSGESNLAISPRPGRTRRARPPPRCVHGLGRSSTTPESTPPPHAPKSPGRSSCGPRPPSPATSPPSKPSRCAGSTCCCASTSPREPCTSQGPRATPAASGAPKAPGTCCSSTATNSPTPRRSCATAPTSSSTPPTRSSEPNV